MSERWRIFADVSHAIKGIHPDLHAVHCSDGNMRELEGHEERGILGGLFSGWDIDNKQTTCVVHDVHVRFEFRKSRFGVVVRADNVHRKEQKTYSSLGYYRKYDEYHLDKGMLMTEATQNVAQFLIDEVGPEKSGINWSRFENVRVVKVPKLETSPSFKEVRA